MPFYWPFADPNFRKRFPEQEALRGHLICPHLITIAFEQEWILTLRMLLSQETRWVPWKACGLHGPLSKHHGFHPKISWTLKCTPQSSTGDRSTGASDCHWSSMILATNLQVFSRMWIWITIYPKLLGCWPWFQPFMKHVYAWIQLCKERFAHRW